MKKRIIKTALIIYFIIAVIYCISCATLAGVQQSRETRFLECSENEGDAGCDSCYFLIYKKHINPYTGEIIK